MKYFKTLTFSAIAIAAVVGLSSWLMPTAVPELSIGDPAPMMSEAMMDVQSESEMSLRELSKKHGLLVVFSCNTCPFVLQWEDRYNELYELCEKNEIGMVLINSNEAKRSGDDSADEMKAKAQKEGYKMPYVIDENHQLADAFGARTTPHIFLFDESAKLAYRGAIDDNGKDKSAVEETYLADAISMMASGKKPEPQVTKAVGCSIKRVKS